MNDMITPIDMDWPDFEGRTYAAAVVSQGRLLWTSGLNALGPDGEVSHPGDVVGQAEVVYRKLAEILASCGAGPRDVVKTTDYIVTREGYRRTAGVRQAFFGEHRPAATGVVVAGLLGRGVLIEVEAVAAIG